MRKNLKEQYNPMYFLSSLGNGGLAVAFYMYLMFMVEHPGKPMANFEHVLNGFKSGNFLLILTIAIALLGIIYFGFKHYKLLFWNIAEYSKFKKTKAYNNLRESNNEVTLMAIPLTLAMSVNVVFIIFGTFIPNLWNYVEYLFPISLISFIVIGVYSLYIFKNYVTRLMLNGDFDFVMNNNLSQMLITFTFSMVAVGFAAPAAMSHTKVVSTMGLLLSIFFISIAIVFVTIHLVLGFKSIFKQGIDVQGSPSLWMMIPILTLIGISIVRNYMGFSHHLLHEPNPSELPLLIILTILVSIQLIFGLIGFSVLKRTSYFNEYIHGSKKSPGSFALICPGVAFMVLGFFFIHWGFVKNGLVTQFSTVYFLLIIPYIYVQMQTVRTVSILEKKLLRI
ncbi:hypothetical protein [Bacillus sp. SM2101]|uniref:TsoY family (seleno)protein n=1 Tax=Bacillus sp. SM2101 TaxID=2805366 RepID=UPI001BDEE969|nr:hypothetical protein [Bacillus sp. SM2101]